MTDTAPGRPWTASTPQFVTIPAGTFEYGDRFGDGFGDERPTRQRDVSPFALACSLVTAGQYLAYLRAIDLVDKPRPDLHAFPAQSSDGLFTQDGRVWCAPGAETYPVVFVSWRGATEYCRWLSDLLGAVVRLPTEAEWQYAAGGPGQTRWASGDEFDRSAYACTSSGPVPVGGYRASAFGLFDMTGNVFEWCLDRYHFPPGAAEPGAELTDSRLIKGGAFILRDPMNFRNARRFSCYELSCLECVGFRPLCEDPAVGALPGGAAA